MRHHLPLALALALFANVAHAQQGDTLVRPVRGVARPSREALRRAAEEKRRRLDFVDEKSLGAQAKELAERRALGTTVLTSADWQTTYLLVRRVASSEPEVHARWDDLVIIRSGTGVIEMGDSLTGGTYRGPGERRGGKLAQSWRIVVHSGDIVRIPAAVPHAFLVSGQEPLEYLLIKQRRQALPIRWTGKQ